MAEIDIGVLVAEAQGQGWAATSTRINEANPANLSGKITEVKIWALSEIADFVVAVFEKVNGDTFTARASQALGTITPGELITKEVDLEVEAGDYIGCYGSGGSMDGKAAGGVGMWYKVGDQTGCSATEFTHAADFDISLYGTGATAALGKSRGIIIG